MKKQEQELKLLLEIESIPAAPSHNFFFCIDGIVKINHEAKSFFEANHFEVEDTMPKREFVVMCTKLHFDVKFLHLIDTAGLTKIEIREKEIRLKNEDLL